jgi:serine/threonine-protein kinase
MGRVYEAINPQINRRVAIKLLNPGLVDNPEVTQRFLNEARAVNLSQHRGLVDIFEAAELPGGQPYLVMEYLEGETLHARLQALGGPMPPESALRIARQIAQARAVVHAQGIVHRDLKPANIMLVHDPLTETRDWVKVLDFGVAKLITGSDGVQTRSGMLLGTPEFMSPEQCKSARVVTDKSDVYSLGIMLYQMLSGALPFKSSSQAMLLIQHIEVPVPRMESLESRIPQALCELVYRMLAKAPADRPSASEAAAALAAIGESCAAGGALAERAAINRSAPRSLAPAPTAPARAVTLGIVAFAILAVLVLVAVLLRTS